MMKKKTLIILISIFLFVPITIFADSNYRDAINYANRYIDMYSDHSKYIITSDNVPYLLDEYGLNYDNNFNTGGLLSKTEYEISKSKTGTSYLNPGIQYWTLTGIPDGTKRYVIDYSLNTKSVDLISGVRVTEYVQPQVEVTGLGSLYSPWVFADIYTNYISSDNEKYGLVSKKSDCSDKRAAIRLDMTSDSVKDIYLCPAYGYDYSNNNCKGILRVNNLTMTVSTNGKNNACIISFKNIIYKITLGQNNATTSSVPTELYVLNRYGWFTDKKAQNNILKLDSIPVRIGHTFNGYYTNSDGTGTQVIDENGNMINGTDSLFTIDSTIYPKWTVNTYNITYNLGGGTNHPSNPNKYTYGIGSTLYAPTKYANEFNGWYKDESFTNKATNISTTDVGDVTLYAKWTEIDVLAPKITINSIPSDYQVDSYNLTGTITDELGGVVSGNISYALTTSSATPDFTASCTTPCVYSENTNKSSLEFKINITNNGTYYLHAKDAKGNTSKQLVTISNLVREVTKNISDSVLTSADYSSSFSAPGALRVERVSSTAGELLIDNVTLSGTTISFSGTASPYSTTCTSVVTKSATQYVPDDYCVYSCPHGGSPSGSICTGSDYEITSRPPAYYYCSCSKMVDGYYSPSMYTKCTKAGYKRGYYSNGTDYYCEPEYALVNFQSCKPYDETSNCQDSIAYDSKNLMTNFEKCHGICVFTDYEATCTMATKSCKSGEYSENGYCYYCSTGKISGTKCKVTKTIDCTRYTVNYSITYIVLK